MEENKSNIYFNVVRGAAVIIAMYCAIQGVK